MCGRFALKNSGRELEEYFESELPSDFSPRYNIAPGQNHPVLIKENSKRSFVRMKWGLVPSWSKDPKIGTHMINARSETLQEKPSFRSAYKKRRAIIPASGFFEWKKEKLKIPYYIFNSDESPMAFGGLWESWKNENELRTFTIITTEAKHGIESIHDRMPLLIKKNDFDRWLDIDTPLEEISDILNSKRDFQIEFRSVSRIVNSPENDSPECLLNTNQASSS